MTFYQAWYLLISVLFDSNLCSESENFIFVQHPELPQYFDRVSQLNPQFESGRFLRYLKRNEKIAKCQQSLAAIIYRGLSSGQALLPPSNPDIDDLLGNVEDLYYREVLKGIQLIEVTLELPGRVVLVPTLPCILDANYSWFITPGFYANEFFVLLKAVADKNFHLHGIIEARPVVNEMISYDQLRIEVHFLKNYRLSSGKIKKRHFCDLENVQRLRLCSSAHVAWRDTIKRQIYQANSAHSDASSCVENATMSFDKISQENTGFVQPIQIDLIGCAINTSRTDPQFYLAADQNVLNAAYILQRHPAESSEEVDKYQLFIHVTDISPLRRETKLISTWQETETIIKDTHQ